MKKRKFDFIFSMGEACSCTSILRSLKLQNFSYPFDWLYGASFYERCKILASNFESFINKNDLTFLSVTKSINCSAYHNNFNNITFNHDFNKDIPFDEMYELVKQKYDRRTKRLFENIEKANSVLMVFIETPESKHLNIQDQEIIDGFNLIKNKYPTKDINLLYFTNQNPPPQKENTHIRKS